MIPNLTSILTVLMLGTPILILIMLLPVLVEIKKPKDAGPRMIMGNISEVPIQMMRMIPLANIEEKQNFDSALIQALAKIIGALPSLEV
jgi:hypothetical protein